jgi:hypothetical protein
MASEKPDSFQCGPFEVSRNPNVAQFVDKLNRLREAVDSCRIMPGVGYTFNRSPGGTTLSIKTGSGATLDNRHPFKVSSKIKDNSLYVYVEAESQLFWTDAESKHIYGLDEWIKAGSKNNDKTYIYLEAEFNKDTGEFTKASIKSSKESPVLVEDGITRCVIATITKTQEIIQNTRINMLAVNACWNGYPSIVIQFYQVPV